MPKRTEADEKTIREYPRIAMTPQGVEHKAISEVQNNPTPGDVIEIREKTEHDVEVILRVLAVVDDHVGYKEYGRGRFWAHKTVWAKRIGEAAKRAVLNAGKIDAPFQGHGHA